MTRLSQELWADSRDIAESCLRHPFVSGLADGSLSSERYARFMAQDAFFLDVYARAYAAGVYRATDPQARRAWHELQSGVFEELKLHAAAAEKLGIDLIRVIPLDAARAYADFLLSNTFGGTVGELVAAMAPCDRLYQFLGQSLAQEGRPSDAYSSWIDTYSDPGFADLVDRIEWLLDEYGEGSANERHCYRRAMQLEHAFFDEAWRT